MEGGSVGYNFKRGPPIPAKFGLIWHNGFTFKEDFYMSFGQNRHNLHIRQKSAKPYIF